MADKKVIIVGIGSLGNALAIMLSAEDYEVVIVENDEEKAKGAANRMDCLVIKGDATDVSILKDAGLAEADAIITLTSDDKTNLMICEIAKNAKVKKIISRVNEPKNEELFINLGVTSIVTIITNALTSIKRYLLGDGHRVVAELGNGEVELIEMRLAEDSQYIGKKVNALKDAVVCAIYRKGEILIPSIDMSFEQGDVVVVASKTKDSKKLEKEISEDK